MKLLRGYLMAATLGVTLGLAASSADREPTTEKECLAHAISCEVAQVKFAEKAATNAASEDVRKLAQSIADEHKKVRDSLLEQAKKSKLAVVEGLEKEHRDQYEKML